MQDQVGELIGLATRPGSARGRAEAELLAIEAAHPLDYAAALLSLTAAGVRDELRLAAAIRWKNVVRRLWTPEWPPPAHRMAVWKALSAAVLAEPVNTVAAQLAFSYGEAASVDFPDRYPTLVDDMLAVVAAAETPTEAGRALETLRAVLRKLTRAGRARDRVGEVLHRCVCVVGARVAAWSPPALTEGRGIYFLRTAVGIVRVALERAPVFSDDGTKLAEDARLGAAVETLRTFATALGPALLRFVTTRDVAAQELLEALGKVFVRVGKVQFALLLPLLPVLGSFFGAVAVGTTGAEPHVPPRLVAQALIFFREVAESAKHPETHDLLAPDPVAGLLAALVRRHLRLTPADIDVWSADAEDFALAEACNSGDRSVRAAAAALLHTLVVVLVPEDAPGTNAAPLALSVIRETMDSTRASAEPDALVQREACYAALTTAWWPLCQFVDIDSLMHGSVAGELRGAERHPLQALVLRRTALFLAAWSAELSNDLRAAALPLLRDMLAFEDLAVNAAAAHAVEVLLDDAQCDPDSAAPYAEALLQALLGVLMRAHGDGTRTQALTALSSVLDRTRDSLRAHGGGLLAPFGQVWRMACVGDMLMQQSALHALKYAVEACGDVDPRQCDEIVVPVLFDCTDVDTDAYLVLGEDALALWEVALAALPELPPAMRALLPRLLAALDLSFESLLEAAPVLHHYVRLGGAEMVTPQLVDLLCRVLRETRDQGVCAVVPALRSAIDHLGPAAPRTLACLVEPLIHHARSSSTQIVGLAAAALGRLIISNPDDMSAVMPAAVEATMHGFEHSMYFPDRQAIARAVEVAFSRGFVDDAFASRIAQQVENE